MTGINRSYLGLSILYALFLATLVTLANLGAASETLGIARSIRFGDKISHLILMGIFSYLVNTALNGRRTTLLGPPIQVGSLVVFVIVAAEEFSQGFFPRRTVNAVDLLADLIGIGLFGWLARRNLKRKGRLPADSEPRP